MINELFNKNIGLVKSIVKKMNYGYVDFDDLYQAGLIGLYEACKKYDINKKNSFSKYASIYIISSIKEELRNNKLIILNKEIIRIKKYINDDNNYNKSINEISEELKVSKDKIIIALENNDDIVSLNNCDNELIEDIKDESRSDKIMSYYVDKLDYLSKQIIFLKYYKNYSQEEIAKILNCSQSKVSRLEKNALSNLKKYYK